MYVCAHLCYIGGVGACHVSSGPVPVIRVCIRVLGRASVHGFAQFGKLQHHLDVVD